jgi:hypothetical protein
MEEPKMSERPDDRAPPNIDPRASPRLQPIEVEVVERRRTGWFLPAIIVTLLVFGLIMLVSSPHNANKAADRDGPPTTTGQNVHPSVPPKQLSPDGDAVPVPPAARPAPTPGGSSPGRI